MCVCACVCVCVCGGGGGGGVKEREQLDKHAGTPLLTPHTMNREER